MNKSLIVSQLVLVSIGIALAFYLNENATAALAAFYGGAVAMTNSLLLVWRIRRADTIARTEPKRGVYVLFVGAIERFVFALVALAIGMGTFGLDPLPLLATFALVQLGYKLGASSTR